MIEGYFDSTCRIIIDEFNSIFKGMERQDKQDYANFKFCEADLVFRLGNPFRHMARYSIQGTKGQDIIVDYTDFEVEVKYWRNWKSGTGKQKTNWEPSFYNALIWLCDEIAKGNKGKRAFIARWSTVFGWNHLLKLGASTGHNPKVNFERLHMLPFLNYTYGKLATVKTKYDLDHGKFRVIGRDSILNWKLYGKEDDEFNLFIYW